MSKQHTPGPWRIKSDPYENGIPYFRFGSGDPLWPNYDKEKGVGFCFTGIMSDADARLIAAAPDLLEALQAMFKVYGSACSSTLAAQVSDAIAKATPTVSDADGASSRG